MINDDQHGDLQLQTLKDWNYVSLARSVNQKSLRVPAIVVGVTEVQLANWGGVLQLRRGVRRMLRVPCLNIQIAILIQNSLRVDANLPWSSLERRRVTRSRDRGLAYVVYICDL